jgi:hypothetical protein
MDGTETQPETQNQDRKAVNNHFLDMVQLGSI